MLLNSLKQDPFAIRPIGSLQPVGPVAGNKPPSRLNGNGMNPEQIDPYGTVTTIVKLPDPLASYQYEIIFLDTLNDNRMMNIQEVNYWLATIGVSLLKNIRNNTGEFGKYINRYMGMMNGPGYGAPGGNGGGGGGGNVQLNPRRDRRHNISAATLLGNQNTASTNSSSAATGPSDAVVLQDYVDHCIFVDYIKDRFKLFGGVITKREQRPHNMEQVAAKPVVTCVNRGLAQTYDYWSTPDHRLETMNTCFFLLKMVKIKPEVTKYQANMTLNSNNTTGTLISKTHEFSKPYLAFQYIPYHTRDEVPPISIRKCKTHPQLILPYLRIGKVRENMYNARSSRVLIAQRTSCKEVARDVSLIINGSLPIELYVNINQ